MCNIVGSFDFWKATGETVLQQRHGAATGQHLIVKAIYSSKA
jgi:hypothetical protein